MDALKLNKEIYTVADIEALPEGKRAELINGRWYDMASPSTIHQRIVSALGWKLNDYIRSRQGKCEVFPAPFAVYLNNDDLNYVEPDITVICDKDKLDEKGVHGAPDIVAEVVSESSVRMDYYIKLFKYRSAGVKEYWVINPMTRVTNLYHFNDDDEKGEGTQVPFSGEFSSYVFEELKICIDDML